MSMFQAPKLNLDKSTQSFASDEELEKELAKGGGNKFSPGQYNLQIKEAYFSGVANDVSWGKAKLVLHAEGDPEGASINHTIMFPLSLNIKYQKPGGKPTLAVYSNFFKPFLGAIGTEVSASNVAQTLVKYFTKTKDVFTSYYNVEVGAREEGNVAMYSELLGKTLKVDIGYEGHYVKKIEGSNELGVFLDGVLVEIDGQELRGTSFDDCNALAMSHGLRTSGIRIVKFHKGESKAEVSDFDDL